ncbi:hypothetical protein Bhyg_13874 [Pseudolycoriella hygida]|uniref:Uncharacterized protein n=1 Tax=Pseudolycoriella hygida TaxID=35572 RepID=A0A9Q0MPG2_9DIPT|nr:hypothetical protein Bhyg_13874 [Pseudolycoriella hygida]
MDKKTIYILFLFNGYVFCGSSVASSWIRFAEAFKHSVKHCSFDLQMFDCMKQSTLQVFDKMITSDVIPLTLDVRLVRKKEVIDSESRNSTDRSGAVLNVAPWAEHILKNIMKVFRTHSLNIDLKRMFVSGRGPHRRRNPMFPMMIFGVTALGVFTIPMGFQFLSVLGGKALLLSKMALMLAIMNGLKRVAKSGVHYGLYHTDHPHHGYHYLDRGDTNRPRSIEM